MTELIKIAFLLIAALAVWALLGSGYWALAGGFGLVLLAKTRIECEDRQELFGVLAGKALASLAIVTLSMKYGWLGPLITAIVRALKAA